MTKLSDLQKWFGTLIAQPLQDDQKMASTTPFGTAIEEEAAKHIAPSPTLKPHQRLELYNQQYWWRLLKCLQQNFPTLTRLYGYDAFNREIGVPYLFQHPPSHWGLCHLGQSLPEWFEKDFERDVARLDAAAQHAFWTGAETAIDFTALNEEEILKKTLTLQAHVHLFELDDDLFTFREKLLKEEVSYWSEHPLPEVEKRLCYFALYRTPKNHVRWKELMMGEYRFLTLFKEGVAIKEACSRVEKEGGKPFQEAEEFLPLWFREWTFLKWFQEK